MAYRAFWDIGGTGAKADATTIWVCQFIGEKIKVLAYYEAQGQDLATHINWLRASGYGAAECFLPHDGAAHDKVFDASYEGALRAAGFSVTVVPNQGRGAASQRIEAARRWFPRIWFNQATCQAGIDALGAYHEKKDDARGIGLGPNHDWSSHGADSFGLMASTYTEPRSLAPIKRNIKGVS
jgi:phage terminase large subunit